ncbi:MAG: PspA/IM30 family protein [Clostridiales bacterium]|nr:PspA/IM30 family protein [Clostridiales bacterium]
MGILTRFKDIMSANINALLDKAEDPEKMIDQCLRNLTSDLAKVKQETASVMAQEASAKRELDECQEKINKMQSYAIKAIEAGNEDDARRFLAEKATLSTKLTTLQSTYTVAADNAKKMREMHDKLTNDIKEIEMRKDAIKSKLAVAKAQERVNNMTSNVAQSNRSIASFERYEQMANKKLDEAQAMAELNSSEPEESLRDLTSKYANGADVDAELEALKASLGLGSATTQQ